MEQTRCLRSPLLGLVLTFAGASGLSGCAGVSAGPKNEDGIQSSTHSVALSWNASTSSVVGYNVYRDTTSGAPYSTKLNSSLLADTAYTDASVQSGSTYYYVATSVDSNDVESSYSNEARAAIP